MSTLRAFVRAACVGAVIACGASEPSAADLGTLVVRLTDAPFPFDSVESVNVFIVRVDARLQESDSAAADAALAAGDAARSGWHTVAEPNAKIDLLTLRGGKFATLGTVRLAAGTYRALRLIVDPAKSDVKLKNATVLTGASTPGIKFPSAAQSGIKVQLGEGVKVSANDTTTVLMDFDVEKSFVLRGNSIMQNGLLFKPVIHATTQP
ncbi:MAG: DUF4382 domain-containing protein [Gemmatimonadaceae bacterium]